MNETILMVMGIVIGVLVVLFVFALIAVKAIQHKQRKQSFNSIPEGGTDASEYGEMLAQKYRNQKIEGEL